MFGLATALRGESKGQIANILAITPEMAGDVLKYPEDCPAFKRLDDVYSALSKDAGAGAGTGGSTAPSLALVSTNPDPAAAQ